MKKLFKKMEKSTNDLPFLSIVKKIQRGNEQHKNSDTTQQYLVDSMLIDDMVTNDETKSKNEALTPIYNDVQTGKDDDNPSTPNFLEHNWICNDGNR